MIAKVVTFIIGLALVFWVIKPGNAALLGHWAHQAINATQSFITSVTA